MALLTLNFPKGKRHQLNMVGSELRKIVEEILSGKIRNEKALEARKKKASLSLGLSSLPSNADILGWAAPEEREGLKILIRKPMRTLSGVAVIAAMTSPARCPHGTCVPCPGGLSCERATPQSYTGWEPAALRAAQQSYDPYKQVMSRLNQLYEIGHPLDKAELIIMGGTITSRPLGYQHWFIKRCLEAMNDYPSEELNPKWQSFHDVAISNEFAQVRNVGTTFETRPDWCGPKEIEGMLRLGATKVELGVQSTRDDLLEIIERGHNVEKATIANTALREAGLKVGFHMMPGLPGSTPQEDLEIFRDLFRNTHFRPDYLKIYPTLVLKGTKLYQLYKRGDYEPLGDEAGSELVSRIKELLPSYVRLQRVQRDIPAQYIVAGVKKSNLRQLAQKKLKARGGCCRCIRCREVGLRKVFSGNDVKLNHDIYRACGGEEHFFSFECENDVLVGFLRLRLSEAARVRELHVYGPLIPIGTRKDGWQHRGCGAKMLRAAESLALEKGYRKIEITSGIGARGYYRRMGYYFKSPYMIKELN